MGFDLVLRNGTVIDGSGSPPYGADIAIAGGRIAAVGRVGDKGAEEIDVEGHVVTPGFIDGHTHMDAQVMWDEKGTCSCWHGVTTVVMGNCGFGLAPVRSDRRDLVVANLERAEDIPREAMAAGIDWQWETFPEYLDVVERLPKGINYAAYVGHSALRTWAMGDRAMDETANDEDMALMAGQLETSLRVGAVGFSTTRNAGHATPDNRPVASRQANWDEVRHLVGVVGRAGRGIFEITPGPGGKGDPETQDEVYEKLYALALESGVPMTLPCLGSTEQRSDRIIRIKEVNAGGGRMFLQTRPRDGTNVMSLRLRLPYDILPEWKLIRDLPIEEQLRALRDPAIREVLVADANTGSFGNRIGTELRKPNYEKVIVLNNPIPPNPTVGQLAIERRMDPVEVMIDLIIESDGNQFFVQPTVEDSPYWQLLESLRCPHTVMTLSDSGAHVSQIMDSSIFTYFLAYWVRAQRAFTLEDGIRMVTSTPALYWGFADRGFVREGYVADLNVFDPDRIGPLMPFVAADLPGGERRLTQRSMGFLATIVGGQVTLRKGEHTGILPGQLLRAGGL